MTYLLDTNILSALMKKNQYTYNILVSKKKNDIYLCETIISEIFFGFKIMASSKKKEGLFKEFILLSNILKSLTWDRDTSKYFGDIKGQLLKKGKIIPDFDITIAAHAMRYNCILVTDNTKDFERIKDLKLENWVR